MNGNDFSQLDAQSSESRLAQMTPEENAQHENDYNAWLDNDENYGKFIDDLRAQSYNSQD